VRVPLDKGSRDVFITWAGPDVKIMEKTKKKAHANDVKKVLQVPARLSLSVSLPRVVCFSLPLTLSAAFPVRTDRHRKEEFHAACGCGAFRSCIAYKRNRLALPEAQAVLC
jgi:hypothetical protein